jgi:uroporphyrin-III C-methyltransferase
VTVHLIGAGPGDPELLTMRAARLLATADVVIHDRLIPTAALELAPPCAQRIDVGKRPGHAAVPQDEINRLLVDHGRRGGTVVRLKGGDPYVFGRGGEEAAALAAAGVDYEVVPGITSAIAAPASAGIPVTLRNQSLAFTVLTGHEDPTSGTEVDWEAHARTGATLVILMGVERIGRIAKRLMIGGRSPATPVAAIRWATTARQQVVRSTLADIGEVDLESPATIVVGDVAALDLRSLTTP